MMKPENAKLVYKALMERKMSGKSIQPPPVKRDDDDDDDDFGDILFIDDICDENSETDDPLN